MTPLLTLLEKEKWSMFHIESLTDTLKCHGSVLSNENYTNLATKISDEKANLRNIQLAIRDQIQYYLDLK